MLSASRRLSAFSWPSRRLASAAVPAGTHIISATVCPREVQLAWSDDTVSTFHHTWLRDHCPSSIHPVSNQRELPLSSIPLDLAPLSVSVEQGASGQALSIRWPAEADPVGAEHVSTFDSTWLRSNCYSRADSRAARGREAPTRGRVRLWGADVDAEMPGPVIAWADLESGGTGAESPLHALLSSLQDYGVGRVSGVPSTMEATEQLGRMLAPVHETFYGDEGSGMWDTAPRASSEVVDTAYSQVSLPLHTDGTYLEQQPGLQLFNCVAQPDPTAGDPLAGATRLADGMALAAKLRREAPDVWDFFCRAPILFQHCEGAVDMRHVAPIFRRDPLTSEVIGVRWNETDRGPLVTLSAEDVETFYESVRTLQAALDSIELTVRLSPGDAIVCDNHRVMHGRHGFTGYRRLLGCYLQADDWRSRWRVLDARGGSGRQGGG